MNEEMALRLAKQNKETAHLIATRRVVTKLIDAFQASVEKANSESGVLFIEAPVTLEGGLLTIKIRAVARGELQ